MNKGFTLIELMVVVAVIGILSMFAMPMYNRYMIRTKMTEVVSLMSTQMSEDIVNLDHYRSIFNPNNLTDWRKFVSETEQKVTNAVAHTGWVKSVNVNHQLDHKNVTGDYKASMITYQVEVDKSKLGLASSNNNYSTFSLTVLVPEPMMKIDTIGKDTGSSSSSTPQKVCGINMDQTGATQDDMALMKYLPTNCQMAFLPFPEGVVIMK